MKKLLATAVASAFAMPALAADVTVSGDVEYKFNQGDANSAAIGDSDITVSASEDLGNGMSASVYLVNASNASTFASALSISGAFGTFEIGNDNDFAAAMFDDGHDVGESAGGDAIGLGLSDQVATAGLKLNLVEGLTVGLSYSAESSATTNSDTATAITGTRSDTVANETATSVAISYQMNGVSLHYGVVDVDTTDTTYTNPSTYGASVAYGPVYIGYNKVKNNLGQADTQITGLGATYNYGPGKFYTEFVDSTDSGGTEREERVYGVSYAMGGVNLYAESSSVDDATSNTTLGVEYSF
jgi:hypothetical protein